MARHTSLGKTWLGPESNRRHVDFQSTALPTELPSLCKRPSPSRADERPAYKSRNRPTLNVQPPNSFTPSLPLISPSRPNPSMSLAPPPQAGSIRERAHKSDDREKA